MNSVRHDLKPYQGSQASLAAILLMALVAIFALCFRDVPATTSAYIIGVSGLTGLAVVVWLKNRAEWLHNAEVVFLAGVCVQYLLAPVLLRLLTNNLVDFKLVDIEVTAERAEVHGAHAGAMCLVLTYSLAFLFASHFIRNHKLPRDQDGTFEASFSRGSLWIIGMLLATLWLTRFILLKTGSYYQLNRSEFQFEDPRYSMLAQIDWILGPMTVTYFFSRCLLCRDALFFPGLIIVGCDCLWNFISGSRERALLAFLSMGVAYVVIRKRISIRMVLAACLARVLVIGFMDYYRYAVRESSSVSEIKVGRILDALQTAKSKSATVGLEQTLVSALARLSDLDSIAAIYAWVPGVVDFLHGDTYSKILFLAVPRVFYPEKPQMIMPINEWFFVNEGGSSPTTIVGEAYLNFGWFGVCLIGLASAILLRISESFLCRNCRNPLFLPIYVSFLLFLSRIHTEPAAVWVGFMLRYCLLMMISVFILRIIEPESRRDPKGANIPQLACEPGT